MNTNTDEEIQSVLFVAREALVYKVPPRTSNEGYRATSWGDNFLWKGRIRVLEIGERCEIRLEDASTGELFALTHYSPTNNAVEPVLDSSRYFVLRVEGEGGRKAYIGMGFEERGDAFDFNVALQSFGKHTSSSATSSTADNTSATTTSTIPAEPPKDYSLKEGQTISVRIPGRAARAAGMQTQGKGLGDAGAGAGGGGGGEVPLLAPPPPSSRRR